MTLSVKLTVVTGPHHTDRYCFRGKTTCVLGRSSDCLVQFSGHQRDLSISRRHCQLEIEPPRVWLKDLHSYNGTFVNGRQIHPEDESPAGFELQDGDMVTLGGTTLQIHLVDCGGHFGETERDGCSPCAPAEKDNSLSLPMCDGDCLKDGGAQILSDGITILWRSGERRGAGDVFGVRTEACSPDDSARPG